MPSSLFDLITLAGSASLAELWARGQLNPPNLARELAIMLRDGTVSLSRSEDFELKNSKLKGNEEFEQLMEAIPNDAKLKELVLKHDNFTGAIQVALSDPDAAEAITVTPTSKGFRRSL